MREYAVKFTGTRLDLVIIADNMQLIDNGVLFLKFEKCNEIITDVIYNSNEGYIKRISSKEL